MKVDDLAQDIRRVDGNHSLGAGALAEALLPFIESQLDSPEGSQTNGPALEALLRGKADADALIERLRSEAKIHAQEASTANATITEIYQLCSGATGEPGNWNGAEPVRALLRERDEMLSAIVDLDEAYCDVHPDMTKEARDFGRKALIAARQVVAKAKGTKP